MESSCVSDCRSDSDAIYIAVLRGHGLIRVGAALGHAPCCGGRAIKAERVCLLVLPGVCTCSPFEEWRIPGRVACPPTALGVRLWGGGGGWHGATRWGLMHERPFWMQSHGAMRPGGSSNPIAKPYAQCRRATSLCLPLNVHGAREGLAPMAQVTSLDALPYTGRPPSTPLQPRCLLHPVSKQCRSNTLCWADEGVVLPSEWGVRVRNGPCCTQNCT